MTEAELLRQQKRALRVSVRSRFPSTEARDAESAALCAQVAASSLFAEAGTLAAYMPLPREADVMPLIQLALDRGKTLLLPRTGDDGRLSFHRVSCLDSLVRGAYGLPEPEAGLPAVPGAEIDLMLVPLEALSPDGLRLGKGGGYYDRLLAEDPPRTALAVLLSWQWVDRVPSAPWDQPLRLAADHRGIHRLPRTF